MRNQDLDCPAHDAGSTTRIEWLLYAARAIDEISSVDDDNTQTDNLMQRESCT